MTPQRIPQTLASGGETRQKIPGASSTYNASAAKLASKNMMNDYWGIAASKAVKHLLMLEIALD
jgi:hypothetical protein